MSFKQEKLHWRQDDYEVTIWPCIIRLLGFGLYASESGMDLSPEELSNPKVQKTITDHFTPRIFKEIQTAAMQQTNITRMNGAYIVKVERPEICFSKLDRYGGTGTCCSFEEFLNGAFNDMISCYFGHAVLLEISEAVRERLKKTGKKN